MRNYILISLILASLFLCQSVFAEPNAYNITIKNHTSGEIIYQKIVPNGEQFYVDTTNGNVHIIINYTSQSSYSYNRVRVTSSNGNTIVNITFGGSGATTHIVSNGIEVDITPITYDFNSSSSSTKAPIPLGVYLITTAFFTYILYRKSKNLT
ncbi:conserved hypothetical protein [Methanocaldococcus sp. FS406-22]|uniref:hypothetical protein n=1 Tax=Methanocaldococcus sp. (strain FS406-22) TaxID=644281 RepID=UPI0001BF3EFF|nr:hypothetical protein [Methanocaldococcus sp. FS406-22]ADC69476.1 conserved hypothetical protein [Methanocaldococcus sp. FS406-22]